MDDAQFVVVDDAGALVVVVEPLKEVNDAARDGKGGARLQTRNIIVLKDVKRKIKAW